MKLTHTQLNLLEPGAHNAPLNRIDNLTSIELKEHGVYRFQEDLAERATLDYLLDFRGSDTLTVILHGATDRSSYQMPRFEWLGTVSKNSDFNSVFFSDPVLSVDEKIQLAWYTGWKDLDCHKIIADRIRILKEKTRAKHIIIAGSSGGGFASLMISAHLEDSVCVPMNPQTAISAYYVNGTGLGPQRFYAERVMPHLVPGGLKEENIPDWAMPMAERLSAVERYSTHPGNKVLYVQNVNDFHFEDHYLPFARSAINGGIGKNFKTVYYSGPHAHVVPTKEIFAENLIMAAKWSKTC